MGALICTRVADTNLIDGTCATGGLAVHRAPDSGEGSASAIPTRKPAGKLRLPFAGGLI